MRVISLQIIFKYIFFLYICFVTVAYGQTRNPLTQYNRMPYLYNPAISGIENFTDVKLGSRYQWVSMEDAPITYFAGFNHAFTQEGASKRIGLSGYIVQENAGPYQDFQAGMASSVHIAVSEMFKISLGVNLGYNRLFYNMGKLRARDLEDRLYQNLIMNGGPTSYFEISPGIMLHSGKLFVGYAPFRIVRTSINNINDLEGTNSIKHTALLGYNYQLNDDWILSPSLLLQHDALSGNTFNFLAKATYQSKIWAGAGFAPNRSVSGIIGVRPNKTLDISYSFDTAIGDVGYFNYGSSHELVLGIGLFNKDNHKPLLW